jgi:hypothetical protein
MAKVALPAAVSDVESGAPGGPRSSVVLALRRVLRPLVRLMLQQGITYPSLLDLLKSIYVETAEREFALDSKLPTDSRLTILTGVHRKDIRRLRREAAPDPARPPALTLGTQIVARWLGDPGFHDAAGKPRPLPRTPSKGGAESFAALVEAVSKNVRPRSVLDELLRLGVVEIDSDDRVLLVTRGFVPGREFDAKALYFGEALHDHLAAGVHNLAGRRPPWLERSVYYDDLSPAAVARIAARAEELSMQVLQEINRDGMALEASDPPSRGQRMRMRLGVFFYAEPAADEPTAPAGTMQEKP